MRMGRPTGKLTRGAKKWAAQFKDKRKTNTQTDTETNQRQKNGKRQN